LPTSVFDPRLPQMNEEKIDHRNKRLQLIRQIIQNNE
jgi:hypothetical protein